MYAANHYLDLRLRYSSQHCPRPPPRPVASGNPAAARAPESRASQQQMWSSSSQKVWWPTIPLVSGAASPCELRMVGTSGPGTQLDSSAFVRRVGFDHTPAHPFERESLGAVAIRRSRPTRRSIPTLPLPEKISRTVRHHHHHHHRLGSKRRSP